MRVEIETPREPGARRTATRRTARARSSTGLLGLATLLAAALGCVSVDVESVVLAPGTDFAAMETFHIVSSEDEQGVGYAEIEAAIARALEERGRTRAGADRADMWVAYRASALDRQKRRDSGDPDANSYRIVDYVEGTLAIDVFDHEAVRRVWHGQGVIDARSRDELRAKVDRVVDAVFAEFPGP